MTTDTPPCTVEWRVDKRIWERLRELHLRPGKREEALSYVWARCERLPFGLLVLVPADAELVAFAPDCYERQGGAELRLLPDVLNGMLIGFARSDWNCLVNVHDHWFSDDARFSSVDDDDDLRFDRYLRSRFEPMFRKHSGIGPEREIYNASLVLGQRSSAARLTDSRDAAPFAAAGRITLLGDHWDSAALSTSVREIAPSPTLARHEGFIAAEKQASIGDLRVALVGCGGLGSILAESLARLGVGHLTLVDGDRLDETNLNRWQGATPGDVGAPKAALLAERVREMCPCCSVTAVPLELEHSQSAIEVAACDIIVAGVDNDEARYTLNHVALQYLQPYFDAGVVIDRSPAVDFRARYFAVLPGVTGCVDCKPGFSLIDRDAVAQSFAHPAVAAERRASGYVADAPEAATASAYPLNQRAAATLVQELLNYVAGWRPMATVGYESWQRCALQRADRDNYPEVPASDCPICSARMGRGSALPLPRRSLRAVA